MIIIFVVIGLLAGVLSGLFGIGGGIVIVPMLLLTGLPMLSATGTSLGALLLPVGALGAWTYYKNGHLDVKASLFVAIGLTIGVYFGARFAQTISPLVMKRAFAVLLVVVAARMWLTAKGP